MIRRTLLVIAVLAAGVVWSPAAAAPDVPPGFAPGGTDPSLVPACTDITPDRPAKSDGRSPQFDVSDPRAKVCAAEPSKVDTEASPPTHHSNGLAGYHFAAVETTPPQRQGIKSKITSVNPNVCHPCAVGDAMFVAEWVMATDRRGAGHDDFIQAGWIERAQEGNTRFVFEYDTASNATAYYSQFALTDGNSNGQTYNVRHTGTGFGWQWSTYVFYNGAWRLLRSAWLDLPPNLGEPGSNTSMTGALEVFINPATTGTSSDYHPCVPDHINTGQNLYVEPQPYANWYPWTYALSPYGTQSFAPYSINLPYSGTAEVWATGGGC